MQTLTISVPVAIVDGAGRTIPRNTPVAVPIEEAKRLLARFGGRIIVPVDALPPPTGDAAAPSTGPDADAGFADPSLDADLGGDDGPPAPRRGRRQR